MEECITPKMSAADPLRWNSGPPDAEETVELDGVGVSRTPPGYPSYHKTAPGLPKARYDIEPPQRAAVPPRPSGQHHIAHGQTPVSHVSRVTPWDHDHWRAASDKPRTPSKPSKHGHDGTYRHREKNVPVRDNIGILGALGLGAVGALVFTWVESKIYGKSAGRRNQGSRKRRGR